MNSKRTEEPKNEKYGFDISLISWIVVIFDRWINIFMNLKMLPLFAFEYVVLFWGAGSEI